MNPQDVIIAQAVLLAELVQQRDAARRELEQLRRDKADS